MNSEDPIKAYKAHITTINLDGKKANRLEDESLRYRAMSRVLDHSEGTPLKLFGPSFVRQLRVHALPKML